MRKLVIIFSLFIIASCKNKQEINKTVPYEDTVILLGTADKDGFMQEPFSNWFDTNYSEYEVKDSLVKQIKPLIENIEIKTFMGTWCGDSQRETPNFYKILDALDFKENKHTLIAVNRDKTTPQEFEKDLNITNVPTFIFYKDGKELNRIVEYPIESLEKDILDILSGKDYKHAYAE